MRKLAIQMRKEPLTQQISNRLYGISIFHQILPVHIQADNVYHHLIISYWNDLVFLPFLEYSIFYCIGSKSAAPCLHSGQMISSGSSSPS